MFVSPSRVPSSASAVDAVGPFLGSALVHEGHGPAYLYAWQALMNPLPFWRSPSKFGGGEGFRSFFVLVVEATGRGAGAATGEF